MSHPQSQSLLDKQSYLRNQIIDQNLDPQAFVRFLELRRLRSSGRSSQGRGGDGEIDLNLWQMKQLEEAVEEFKKAEGWAGRREGNPISGNSHINGNQNQQQQSNSQKSIDSASQSHSNNQVSSNIEQSQISMAQSQLNTNSKPNKPQNRPKIKYFNGTTDTSIPLTSLPCLSNSPANRSQPIANEPIYAVSHTIRTSGGFFLFGLGATHSLWIAFGKAITEAGSQQQQRTENNDTPVQRKSQDFDWLRRTLVRAYPTHFVPSLEPLRGAIDPKDIYLCQKRIHQCMTFINACLVFPMLRQSEPLFRFIRSMLQDFINYRDGVQHKPPPSITADLSTRDGHISGILTDNMVKFIQKSPPIITDLGTVWSNIAINLEAVLADLDAAVKHVKKLSNNCAQLNVKYNELLGLTLDLNSQKGGQQAKHSQQSKPNEGNPGLMPSLCLYMNSHLASLASSLKIHLTQLATLLDGLVKPSIERWTEVSHSQRRFSCHWDDYQNKKSALLRKKQKLLPQPDKWGYDAGVPASLLQTADIIEKMLPTETQQLVRVKEFMAVLALMWERSCLKLVEWEGMEAVKKIQEYQHARGVQATKSEKESTVFFEMFTVNMV